MTAPRLGVVHATPRPLPAPRRQALGHAIVGRPGHGTRGAITLFRDHDLRALAGGAGYLVFDIATPWATVRAFGAHPSVPRSRWLTSSASSPGSVLAYHALAVPMLFGAIAAAFLMRTVRGWTGQRGPAVTREPA